MANMDLFGFFDFAEGDDDTYKYTSAEFSEVFAALSGNGVSSIYGNKLAVTPTEGTLNIAVDTGACFINGRYGEVSSPKTLIATPTASGESRKDTVVAELDTDNRVMKLDIIEGTASDYPTLLATQLPLANIVISNESGAVISECADMRSFIYTSSLYPSIQVIYSQTVPAYVEGAIWLKPQMVD